MKITNKHGLPESFVAFANADNYSSGNADISVTSLIDSPRIRIMRMENRDNMETDVVDMIWPLFGTAVHGILEASSDGDNVVQEERLFHEYNGWTLSGAIDHQEIDGDNVVITDYKVTSAWSVIFGKSEWELQQNCYAQLVRDAKGKNVTSIRICAILRDWSRRTAQMQPDYPDAPVVVIELPLWSAEKAKAYIDHRVALHQEADLRHDVEGEFPLCSDEERWLRGEKWAVMKGSAKRAVKLFDEEQGAIEYVGDNKLLRVEHRPGQYVRCDGDYCGVAGFCSQYRG
jgi:hypothetical protein